MERADLARSLPSRLDRDRQNWCHPVAFDYSSHGSPIRITSFTSRATSFAFLAQRKVIPGQAGRERGNWLKMECANLVADIITDSHIVLCQASRTAYKKFNHDLEAIASGIIQHTKAIKPHNYLSSYINLVGVVIGLPCSYWCALFF